MNIPLVRITDPEHPHYPETGRFTGEVITMRFSGKKMAKIALDSCRHGTDACYVSPGQIQEIAEPGTPARKRTRRPVSPAQGEPT
jgi:hypothetical protein